MASGAASLGTQLADAARSAWDSATAAAANLAAAVAPADAASTSSQGQGWGSFGRLTSRPFDRGLAAIRWSTWSTSALAPQPSPPLDDPRMLLSLLSLTKVVYDEVVEHHLHQQQQHAAAHGRADGSGGGLPLPLPPVTAALACAALWRFLTPALLRDVCLSPYCVVERHEWARLWGSVLVHLDAPHLACNLAALIPDAAATERAEGSAAFAADVGVLAGVASGLFVGWAVLERDLLHRSASYYSVGAVGMSSLAFALQVVRGEARRGTTVAVMGIPLPAQHAWVAQLAVTALLAPESSFTGHVCGVLAGLLHVYLLRPALRVLLGLGPHAPPPGRGQQPRVWGSGTTSGRPVVRRGPAGGGGGGSGGRGVGGWLGGALAQLGLAAAAVALYALAAQRRQREPLSSWRLR